MFDTFFFAKRGVFYKTKETAGKPLPGTKLDQEPATRTYEFNKKDKSEEVYDPTKEDLSPQLQAKWATLLLLIGTQ